MEYLIFFMLRVLFMGLYDPYGFNYLGKRFKVFSYNFKFTVDTCNII